MLKAKNTALVDKIQKERGCARSSARVYASNINRIHRDYLSSTKRSGNLRWLYDHSEKLLAKLKKIENINTQRNLLAAALVGLDMQNAKTKKESYVKQIGALNKKKEEIARAGNLSEKQAAKFISWKEILKLRRLLSRTVRLGNFYSRKVSKREFTIMQQNVVLHLYTEMPPVRNDWSTVRYLTESEYEAEPKASKQANNFLVMGRGGYRVYWADYKTKKKHGILMNVLPKTLQTVLKRHIRYLKANFDNNFLLLNSNGDQMSRNGLTKFLQRLFFKHFRKKTSTSALRSIFLSHTFDKKVLEKQLTIAKQMHHTPEVARDFYVKKVNE